MSAPSDQPTGLVIVGYGEWGPNHVRVFQQLDDACVIGVVDKDPDRRAAVARRQPHLRVADELDGFLEDPRVQAVVVATPTATHHAVCRRALTAGRHVLCEKPLTISASESDDLVDLAAAQKCVLAVGHVFLHNPGILKLKELISSGELGQVHFLRSVRTNLGPIRSDVNSVYDLASHDVSIFNFLLDARPTAVSAVAQSYLRSGVEDMAVLTLRYPAGVLATTFVSWLDPRKVRFLAVTGDRRMATWDDLDHLAPVMIYDKGVVKRHAYRDFGEFSLITRDGDIAIPKLAAREPLQVQAQHFLSCIRDQERPVSDGAFARDVVRVLEACQLSINRRGDEVSL